LRYRTTFGARKAQIQQERQVELRPRSDRSVEPRPLLTSIPSNLPEARKTRKNYVG
jgi:hypothetical protein